MWETAFRKLFNWLHCTSKFEYIWIYIHSFIQPTNIEHFLCIRQWEYSERSGGQCCSQSSQNLFLIKPHLSYFQFPYHKQWVLRFQFSYYWSSATYPKFSLEFSRKKNDQLGNHLGWESHLTLTTALVRGWRKEGRQTLVLGSCC